MVSFVTHLCSQTILIPNQMLSAITACVKTYLKELCVCQKSCSLEPVSLFALLTVRNIPFVCKSGPPKYPFLLMSVTKQGQAGRFTPQWHPCYSVALLPSVSPWLPQNISAANITLTQKFLIALTELPVYFFFLSKQRCLPVQHTSRVMFWSLWRYV